MKRNGPNSEQLAAVIAFAEDNGRTWKASLNDAWMTDGYRRYIVRDDASHLLQQVRNQFGPRWLKSFKAPTDYNP